MHGLALFGAAAFALTPVAVLMFRFNNPDALLMLLLTAATYCVVRAQRPRCWRWRVSSPAWPSPNLQAFLVLPPLGIAYLLLAPASWRQRIIDGDGRRRPGGVSAAGMSPAPRRTPATLRPYMAAQDQPVPDGPSATTA